jgi:hypothetical protein
MKNLLIALAVGLLFGFASGWKIESWKEGSKFSSFQADVNGKAAAALVKVQSKMQADDEKIKALADQITEANLQNEKLEIDRDNAIAVGTKRVFVHANCPPVDNASAHAGATGRGDGSTAELDPAYRRTLSDLRSGVERQYQQIIVLQAYAQSCATP